MLQFNGARSEKYFFSHSTRLLAATTLRNVLGTKVLLKCVTRKRVLCSSVFFCAEPCWDSVRAGVNSPSHAGWKVQYLCRQCWLSISFFAFVCDRMSFSESWMELGQNWERFPNFLCLVLLSIKNCFQKLWNSFSGESWWSDGSMGSEGNLHILQRKSNAYFDC